MRPLVQPAPAVPETVNPAPGEVAATPGAVSVLTIADKPSECNCPGGCGPSRPAASADEEYEKDIVR
jgi:hypothetical protein